MFLEKHWNSTVLTNSGLIFRVVASHVKGKVTIVMEIVCKGKLYFFKSKLKEDDKGDSRAS